MPTTPWAAHNLGNVTNGQIVQAAGVIGTDPFYDPVNDYGNPNGGNQANQVDLYTFQVSGSGLYALDAEVFAGRIGSSLEPALTLFGYDADGNLIALAGNNGSGNDTVAESDVGAGNHTVPLFTDPVLFASLTPGDYVLAVSTTNNYANPLLGKLPGENGVFDPNVSHSGTNGSGSLGNYVLNLRVQAAETAPQVVSATVSSGGASSDAVTGYPTSVNIQFSGPVNLRQLAFDAFEENLPGNLSPIFITDANGNTYYPRLQSYNDSTYDASFYLLDRLPNGDYTLHISGPDGLTDFSGTPILGNALDGDYVVGFTVSDAPALGLDVASKPGIDSVAKAQNLGVIFGHEFEQQFTVSANKPAGTTDYYAFQVLESTTTPSR